MVSVTTPAVIECRDCIAKTKVEQSRNGDADRWSYCPHCGSDNITVESQS